MQLEFKSNRVEVEQAIEAGILKGMTACGIVAEGYAKVNITDQHAIDTGNLRNSITYQVGEEGNAAVLYVGTNVEYAPYIEYGTGEYSATGGGTTKKSWVYRDSQGEYHRAFPQKPRPYLKPALSEHADEYNQILNDYIKNEIK